MDIRYIEGEVLHYLNYKCALCENTGNKYFYRNDEFLFSIEDNIKYNIYDRVAFFQKYKKQILEAERKLNFKNKLEGLLDE